MNLPTFDKDGYPTEETHQRIESWDVLKEGILPLIEFLREAWRNAEWGFDLKKGPKSFNLNLHTGGWSGNETLIGALQQSDFWLLYWESSRRGGHYTFKGRLRKA